MNISDFMGRLSEDPKLRSHFFLLCIKVNPLILTHKKCECSSRKCMDGWINKGLQFVDLLNLFHLLFLTEEPTEKSRQLAMVTRHDSSSDNAEKHMANLRNWLKKETWWNYKVVISVKKTVRMLTGGHLLVPGSSLSGQTISGASGAASLLNATECTEWSRW